MILWKKKRQRKQIEVPMVGGDGTIRLPSGIPEDLSTTVIKMPYGLFSIKELEDIFDKSVQLRSQNRVLSNSVADIWIVEHLKTTKDGTSRVRGFWLILNSNAKNNMSIFRQFDRCSGKEHIGFSSSLLKFAIQEKELHISKRIQGQ
jgi:hypothetical protein